MYRKLLFFTLIKFCKVSSASYTRWYPFFSLLCIYLTYNIKNWRTNWNTNLASNSVRLVYRRSFFLISPTIYKSTKNATFKYQKDSSILIFIILNDIPSGNKLLSLTNVIFWEHLISSPKINLMTCDDLNVYKLSFFQSSQTFEIKLFRY